MKHVLLVAHHERPDAAALAADAAAWLEERGHSAWMTPDDAAACSLGGLAGDPLMRRADLVVSLGGDGTVLRAVQLAAADDAPVLGVNVGMLGYLTEVEPTALTACLEQWFDPSAAATWTIDERMMLEVVVRRADGSAPETWTALNDGVVEKLESGHTVRLQVQGRDGGRAVVLRNKAALDVAGANAQLHHHGCVRRLGELKRFLVQAHDGGQVRARVHQPHRRLHRKGVRALLNDGGSFAVVLAHHDQRTAHHAR